MFCKIDFLPISRVLKADCLLEKKHFDVMEIMNDNKPLNKENLNFKFCPWNG